MSATPGYSMSPTDELHRMEHVGPPRWSALAVTAFVLSFIGFLGFTAILGIILAIAGIVVTRSGRRKGLGLAVAAIPISMFTGALGALVVYGGVTFYRMFDTAEKLVPVMSAPSDTFSEGSDKVLALGSAEFQSAVGKDRMEHWLREVRKKHGNLAGLERADDLRLITTDASDLPVLNLLGKFTNGPALISVTFSQGSLLEPKIHDVEVDGVSPRPDAKEPNQQSDSGSD